MGNEVRDGHLHRQRPQHERDGRGDAVAPPHGGLRLERIRELTGLDPLRAEDREQLGVALEARAVLAAAAPPPRSGAQ